MIGVEEGEGREGSKNKATGTSEPWAVIYNAFIAPFYTF